MSPRVDGTRLLDRLAQLRKIGEAPHGGVTREAFGPDDVAGRDLVASWMSEAGLTTEVDPAANLVGRRAGSTGRWLASGSHLDTVVEGGWLDGAYGAVAAVEVAATLADAGIALDHGYVAVAFANEEGARGTSGMTGSRALVADLPEAELDLPDDDGVTLRERIERAGGDPRRIAGAAWAAPDYAGFVELHIEQGPVLASRGATLGAVTAITGRQAFDIELVGSANHAGTTPMELRRDALAAGAEVLLVIEALPSRGVTRVATVGHLSASPNVRNVVPGRAVISAEIRDEDPGRLDAAMARIDEDVRRIAARREVGVTLTWGQRVQPTQVDAHVLATVTASVAASGHPFTELPSGAGHDAQILGAAIPMGMIFVPSIGGVSHSPVEDTAPEHLVVGAQALLDTILALDAGSAP